MQEIRQKLFDKLKECSEKYPELRFGQMLCVIVRSGKLQFDISDEELLKKVEEFIEELP